MNNTIMVTTVRKLLYGTTITLLLLLVKT